MLCVHMLSELILNSGLLLLSSRLQMRFTRKRDSHRKILE